MGFEGEVPEWHGEGGERVGLREDGGALVVVDGVEQAVGLNQEASDG